VTRSPGPSRILPFPKSLPFSGAPVTSGQHFLVLLVATWMTGCVAPSGTGRALDHSVAPSAEVRSNSIYLIRHGWHTGLAVNRSEISTADWPESMVFQDAKFIEVGWGDEAYYRARFMNPLVMAKAAFLPSRSAIHVVGIREPLQGFFAESQIIEIKVTPRQMRKLCRFIHDSYACDENAAPRQLCAAHYGSGGIYRANGRYYIPNTCNIWTARALAAAECPVAVPLCTTAEPLVVQSKRFGTEVQKRSTMLPVIYPFFNFEPPPIY
jgi:uncharacterized protein (TIGR02117 family)